MFSKLCVVALLVATCYAAQYPDNNICTRKHGYHPVDNSCDAYYMCDDYKPMEMICPDGLHFDSRIKWPEYPCGYPMDVPCDGRASLQPARSTAECPHQYGYYQSQMASEHDCDMYRMCVAGRAIEMRCPAGLAFNHDSGRCDWPENVADCNTDVFLDFSCPAAPVDALGYAIPELAVNYPHPHSCYYFYSCAEGRARLLSCDHGLAFDAQLGRCVDDEDVDCSAYPAVSQ